MGDTHGTEQRPPGGSSACWLTANGVLARISSLLCRRGFNIDSLTVSATNDPAVSRITVTLRGTEQALNQLILQTERLEVTRQIFELDPDKSLQRGCWH